MQEPKINPNAKPLVVRKDNSVLYRYEGNNTYTNLQTNKQGTVDENIANKVFAFPLALNQITLKYPLVELLLIKLKMNIQVKSENSTHNYKI